MLLVKLTRKTFDSSKRHPQNRILINICKNCSNELDDPKFKTAVPVVMVYIQTHLTSHCPVIGYLETAVISNPVAATTFPHVSPIIDGAN